MTCNLFLEDIAYEPTVEYPQGYSEELWVCELPYELSHELGMFYVDIEDGDAIVGNATSGVSTLTVSEAIIDIRTPRLYVPKPERARVDTTDRSISIEDNRDRGRALATNMGTLSTLVIRVLDSNGKGPDADQKQLENDVFEDDSCLKSQYEACSYNKLKIEPFKNDIVENGVVDVQVDYDLTKNSNRAEMQQLVFQEANNKLGDLSDDKFGLVLFCLPPGTGNWLAYAYSNHKYSFYNNEWCTFVSAQLHEVGHNLGLAHSGILDGGSYEDKQGYMGFSFDRDDQDMCFNAAKSYQLGWYEDQVETIDPLNMAGSVQRFVLNGVVDYSKNPQALVVLRLEQTNEQQDYYIGFNRVDGMNKDTGDDYDKVTILRKDEGGPMEYGTSTKIGSLNAGETFTIENFNGNRDIKVRFLGNLGGDATIEIIDGDEPTSAPVACLDYTIEIMTDNYPGDTSWSLVETTGIGLAYGSGGPYADKLTLFSNQVCLPYDTEFKFTIRDNYEDGLCCGQGKGFYRALDNNGEEIFLGGQKFATDIHVFSTGANPDPTQAPVPTFGPTSVPTRKPTVPPTDGPTAIPTAPPTPVPTVGVTTLPTRKPTTAPTASPTAFPTGGPTTGPTTKPTDGPTAEPTTKPTDGPTEAPVVAPTEAPVDAPTESPVVAPTEAPVDAPTESPVVAPTEAPVDAPTESPVVAPTEAPVDTSTSPPTRTDSGEFEEAKYTVEIKTDKNPQDINWSIVENLAVAHVAFGNMFPMTNEFTVYTTEVVLKVDTDYKLVVEDAGNDGICCGNGNGRGFYKIKDATGNVIVNSKFVDEDFGVKEVNFTTTGETNNKCVDKEGKFRLKKKSRKRTCKQLAKKNKCNKERKGLEVWRMCPVSCEKCDSI